MEANPVRGSLLGRSLRRPSMLVRPVPRCGASPRCPACAPGERRSKRGLAPVCGRSLRNPDGARGGLSANAGFVLKRSPPLPEEVRASSRDGRRKSGLTSGLESVLGSVPGLLPGLVSASGLSSGRGLLPGPGPKPAFGPALRSGRRAPKSSRRCSRGEGRLKFFPRRAASLAIRFSVDWPASFGSIRLAFGRRGFSLPAAVRRSASTSSVTSSRILPGSTSSTRGP